MTAILRRLGVLMFVTVIAALAMACPSSDDTSTDSGQVDDDASGSDDDGAPTNEDDDVSDDESDDDLDGDDAWDDDDDSECESNQPPVVSNVHFEVDGVDTPLPISGDQGTMVTLVADYDDPDCNLAGGGLAYRGETLNFVMEVPADLPCDQEENPLRLSFFPVDFVERGPQHGVLYVLDQCSEECDAIPFDTDIQNNPFLCLGNHPTELMSVSAFVNGVETPQPLNITFEDTVELAFAYSDVECNTGRGDVWFHWREFGWILTNRIPLDMPCEATEDAPFSIVTELDRIGYGFKSGEIFITDNCADSSNGLPMVVTVH